jgi:glycosyltransferase involved in cell wall biosynthesis
MLKIVHTVEKFLPEVNGMSEVVRQISLQLVKLGHEVIICTSFCEKRNFDFWEGIKIVSFKIKGNAVIGYSGDDVENYKNYILTQDYDVLTNFAAQQWATDLVLDLLNLIDRKKFFVPTGFSALYSPIYSQYFNKMKHWLHNYNSVVFLSDNYQDINFARDNFVQNCVLIPNGASQVEFQSSLNSEIRNLYRIPLDHKLILHVGSYTGSKGHDEALNIFLKSQFKKASIVFIGQNFFSNDSIWFTSKICWFYWVRNLIFYRPLAVKNFIMYLKSIFLRKNSNIYLLDCDRKTTVEFYKSADIFLFPSNIECSPIVLFESAASRTMFLSSDVGNASEIIKWTKGGVLLPTSKLNNLSIVDIVGSASILDKYLSDDDLRNKHASLGYNSWMEKFTWENISRQYMELYLSN